MRISPIPVLVPVCFLALSMHAPSQITPDAGPPPDGATARIVPRPQEARPLGNRPIIVLTGYWPPTNEMLRPFSNNTSQNPHGWVGANWENRGYDVYAFFPEFPTNTWPKGVGDFEVDYQDTSSDFWRIIPPLAPRAIVTCSRGGPGSTWEIEMTQRNFTSWFPDSLAPTTPSPNPPDPTILPNHNRRGTVPGREIEAAVRAANIGATPSIDYTNTAGSYLSGYMAYHGMWYQSLRYSRTDPGWCVCAAHIHVGTTFPVASATKAVEATLREVIAHVDRVTAGTCQHDIGFGGSGPAWLTMCGKPLASGGSADLLLEGTPANSAVVFLLGLQPNPLSYWNRLVLPVPALSSFTTPADRDGRVRIAGIAGGGGPLTLYAQAFFFQLGAPGNLGMSNALAIEFLP